MHTILCTGGAIPTKEGSYDGLIPDQMIKEAQALEQLANQTLLQTKQLSSIKETQGVHSPATRPVASSTTNKTTTTTTSTTTTTTTPPTKTTPTTATTKTITTTKPVTIKGKTLATTTPPTKSAEKSAANDAMLISQTTKSVGNPGPTIQVYFVYGVTCKF